MDFRRIFSPALPTKKSTVHQPIPPNLKIPNEALARNWILKHFGAPLDSGVQLGLLMAIAMDFTSISSNMGPKNYG